MFVMIKIKQFTDDVKASYNALISRNIVQAQKKSD
jgi:hypothetical protein